MKAVVIDRPGSVALIDVAVPTCGPDEVLIQSHAAGVCPTDLKISHGLMPDGVVRYPCIPGHEWTGIVTEAGAGLNGVAVGDHVVCEGMIPCTRCARCVAGETNLCENYDQLGFTRPGGYSASVVVPARIVHRLPDGVSLLDGCLIEPAACAMSALDRGRFSSGDVVGVVGAGTIGCLTIALAKALGAREIVAFGIRDAEIEAARQFGATQVFRSDLPEHPDRGIGLVIDTAGTIPAMQAALGIVRRGGRVVSVGTAGEGRSVEIPADIFVRKHIELIGSLSYTQAAWTRTVELAPSLGLGRLIARRFPLAKYESAFALVEKPAEFVGRVVLEH